MNLSVRDCVTVDGACLNKCCISERNNSPDNKSALIFVKIIYPLNTRLIYPTRLKRTRETTCSATGEPKVARDDRAPLDPQLRVCVKRKKCGVVNENKSIKNI